MYILLYIHIERDIPIQPRFVEQGIQKPRFAAVQPMSRGCLLDLRAQAVCNVHSMNNVYIVYMYIVYSVYTVYDAFEVYIADIGSFTRQLQQQSSCRKT